MSTLYQQQLNYVFDRPVSEPAWYWQARLRGKRTEQAGAFGPFVPDLTTPLIDDFLNNSNHQPAALIQYARSARMV